MILELFGGNALEINALIHCQSPRLCAYANDGGAIKTKSFIDLKKTQLNLKICCL